MSYATLQQPLASLYPSTQQENPNVLLEESFNSWRARRSCTPGATSSFRSSIF